MKISQEVLIVLAECKVVESALYLPNVQLERKLYTSVNKVLQALGGKWNRSAKAHLFSKDIKAIIEEAVLTGEYTDEKKEFQFFETPEWLAKELVELADIKIEEEILEPSAGRGRIASLIPDCYCIELNPDNYDYLVDNDFMIIGKDFLKHTDRYDVIVANPPFTQQQDIDHINHMLDLATRKVVSVASASVMFRDNKKTVDFRNRIAELGGTIKMLPERSFAESGTAVSTCVVVVDLGAI